MQWLTEETGWLLPEDDDPLLSAYHAPERLAALGAGLAGAASCIMVGSADSDAAKSAALMLCGSIAAAGGTVCCAPECIPAALQAGAALHHCGVIVHCGGIRMQMFSRGLLPLTEAQRRMIRAGAAAPRWVQHTEYGSITEDRALMGLYVSQLKRLLPAQLPFRTEIQTASPLLGAVLRPVFSGGYGKAVTLRLSADGRHASVYSEETGWLFYEKLLLMCAQYHLQHGQDVALPAWLPHIAEEMAGAQHILRYAMHPDGKDTEARQLAAEQSFTLDGAVLCAEILRICAETGQSLAEWAASLPACYLVRRILRTHTAADAALRCAPALHAEAVSDGLRVRTAAAEALLHPSHSGRAVSMLVEARSMEAANELAGDIAEVILNARGIN